MNLLTLIHQKLELFRLEQRYTRRRAQRTTFISEAQYIDGEYLYTPGCSYTAKCSAGNSDSDAEGERTSKAGRRLSKMGLNRKDWRREKAEKTQPRVDVRDVKWSDIRSM
jgi:hypothetical protein